jgi:hypothetical protein
MSRAPRVLKPVAKQLAAVQRPVQATPASAQVLRVVRASTQLSFQFHRLP